MEDWTGDAEEALEVIRQERKKVRRIVRDFDRRMRDLDVSRENAIREKNEWVVRDTEHFDLLRQLWGLFNGVKNAVELRVKDVLYFSAEQDELLERLRKAVE